MERKDNSSRIVFFSSIAVVVLIVIFFAVYYMSRSTEDVAPSPSPTAVAETATPAPTATPIPEEKVSATIALGGDIVMHSGLNTEARLDLEDGEAAEELNVIGAASYDYEPLFGIITEYIADADYAVATLVTSLAETGEYSSYPMFRTPPELANSLSDVGFDLINTASSHAMDSYKSGLDFTLSMLEVEGMEHVGTYKSEEERAENSGATFVDINGINVAFVSYTCDTNGVPVTGFEYALNIATEDYLTGGDIIDYELMSSDMEYVRSQEPDLVIAFMSWGTEFDTEPNEQQLRIADHLLYEGVDIIVGGHTLVPQPMEKREVVDIDGEEKTAYVFYSLGNLLSCQNDKYTDMSAIVNLTVEKGLTSGNVTISDISYEPIFMVDLYDYGIDDYGWHYRLANINAALESWDSGEAWDFMTEEIHADMLEARESLRSLLGEAVSENIG